MTEPSATPFTPEVVAAVQQHMNVDHADDSLLICQALGGQPQARRATMSGMDADQIHFDVVLPDGEVTVSLPWSERLTERAQVRAEVTRMYQEACVAAGVTPRAGGEH